MLKNQPTRSGPAPRAARWLGALLLAGLAAAGCGPVDDLRESLTRRTPHEAYAEALATAGLAETALGRAWHAAGTEALARATPVALPFREARYLDPAQPAALGYQFALRRGQQLFTDVALAPGDTARVFVDLFEVPADSTAPLRHRASADSTRALVHTVRRDGTYLVRVQPELLRGGRYTVTFRTDASLAFPVAGVTSDAIRSFFGDRRDGGRRQHHGVDIFAAKGTPALAAAEAVVTRVRNGGLGGKVVWLRDADGHALYYAHLDSQLVRAGTRVAVGDTVGLVGNTGNARTTPPHLHFGIYRNGPIDPFPFVHRPRARPAAVRVDTSRLGLAARVAGRQVRLRAGPDVGTDVVRAVPRHTALRVAGAAGLWYRVTLPDGTAGYVVAAEVEPVDRPVRRHEVAAGQAVRTRPVATAPAIDSLAADAVVPVLGRFGAFLYVEAPTGRAGWIEGE